MRFLLFISFILLFGCSNSELPLSASQTENAKLLYIDSLFQESKQFFRSNSDSIPIFDSILKEAYKIAKATENKAKMGMIYNELGKRNRSKSKFSKAIWYHQQAILLAEQTNNDMLHAKSIHEQAVVFRRMNDNAQALRLYVESLEWAEAVSDTFLIHCSLNGIGNVYFHYKDYEKAIDYFQQSLNFLGKEKRNFLGEAINTNTIGEAWLFMGNSDSAIHYLNRSLNINKKLNSELGQAICYNGIGMVYLENNEYDKAINAIKHALDFDHSKIPLRYVTMIMVNLGNTYLQIKDYSNAEKYLLEAYEIASNYGIKGEALDATNFLAKLYKEKGNLLIAMKHTQIGANYKDSINKDLVTQNTESMNALYKAEQQEREIIILKQNAELDTLKLERQRNTVFGMVGVLLVFILFFIFIFRQRKLQSLVNQIELEQKLFRSQINPHFIFNSVAAMQNFIMNNDKMEAADYLANFSRLMRNILMSSRTESIILDTEIEILEDYLKLQKLRFSQKFEYEIKVDNDIEREICLIPPMLVQPFIENSIEHGLRELQSKGEIKVAFEKQNNSLIITVDDNGVGITRNKKANHKHESLATKITLERLKNYQRITKRESTLKVYNKADSGNDSGVIVIITIPYKEE